MIRQDGIGHTAQDAFSEFVVSIAAIDCRKPDRGIDESAQRVEPFGERERTTRRLDLRM
jgi:hypothetical protein